MFSLVPFLFCRTYARADNVWDSVFSSVPPTLTFNCIINLYNVYYDLSGVRIKIIIIIIILKMCVHVMRACSCASFLIAVVSLVK